MNCEFDRAILSLSDNLKRTFEFIPQDIKQKCEEIRLRAGLPVCITVRGRTFFIEKDGSVTDVLQKNALKAEKEDIKQTLLLLCNNSVYLHENEIKHGFISLPGGNRAGVCGVFNTDGMLVDVTSLNIRIARQIFDCALPLLKAFDGGGMLIAGPPGSGKTTVLRDLIRLLSNGLSGSYRRVAVIDSRGEISGGFGSEHANDLGANTDVLYTADKAKGTQIALRTIFPDIIAFDEIGTTAELDSVRDCFNAGVSIITTAHCLDFSDIIRRRVTADIIKSGAVSKVVCLDRKQGLPPKILSVKELFENAVC